MKTKSINTRIATQADIEELVSIINFAYRGGKANKGWTTEEGRISGARITADELAELMTAPGKTLISADVEDGGTSKLAGCVVLETADSHAYIGMLSVDPDLQSGGIGGALMTHAENEAKRLGKRFVDMYIVSGRPELQAWYERIGYAPTGETKPFPVGESSRWQTIDSTVHFLVLRKELV